MEQSRSVAHASPESAFVEARDEKAQVDFRAPARFRHGPVDGLFEQPLNVDFVDERDVGVEPCFERKFAQEPETN